MNNLEEMSKRIKAREANIEYCRKYYQRTKEERCKKNKLSARIRARYIIERGIIWWFKARFMQEKKEFTFDDCKYINSIN